MYIRQKNFRYKTGNTRYSLRVGIYLCIDLEVERSLDYWHSKSKYKNDCAYGSRNNILQTLNLPLPYLRNFVEGT